MSDFLNESTEETASSADGSSKRSFSRRTALKAGAAAGVGIAAWSGASITSLGGTPAYATAAGCTGVITVTIGTQCDNTDMTSTCAGGIFSYQHLGVTLTGFGITNEFNNQTCCSDAANNKPSLTWTIKNLQCTTHVEIWHNLNPCKKEDPATSPNLLAQGIIGPIQGGVNGGSALIDTECFQYTIPGATFPDSSIFTNIYAKCNSIGAPSQCLA